MKILLLNHPWFAGDFRAAGHEVLVAGYTPQCDLRFTDPLLPISQILPSGFTPDLVLVLDNSAPILVTGLHELSCPMIFYAVDTHLRLDLHCYLSRAFDLLLLAQKDFVQEFVSGGFETPVWLPLFAGGPVEVSEEKVYPASFVGTLDPMIHPQRVQFFEELKKLTDVTVTTGAFPEIFTRSEVVVNQSIGAELNFRVFEAMTCGAALVTENIGNGLTDLFTPDRHLVVYERNNPVDASRKIQGLLADKRRCREIGRAGREEVLAKHCACHRARQILEWIPSIQRKKNNGRYFAWMLNQAFLANILKVDIPSFYPKALETALEMLERGMKHGEVLDDFLAFHALRVILELDRVSQTDRGVKLLPALAEANPGNVLLRTGQLRALVQSGNKAEAETLARSLFPGRSTAEMIAIAETMVQKVLAGKTA